MSQFTGVATTASKMSFLSDKNENNLLVSKRPSKAQPYSVISTRVKLAMIYQQFDEYLKLIFHKKLKISYFISYKKKKVGKLLLYFYERYNLSSDLLLSFLSLHGTIEILNL